jgi:drug/metabolite transporter (DMT)-like permease
MGADQDVAAQITMTDSPQFPPPPPPPQQRDGCLTALMIVVGIVLLLPGICGVIIAGLDPHELMVDPNTLLGVLGLIAVGVGGIALIWWAVRQPR